MIDERTINAADPKQVKEAARKEKFTQQDLILDLENVMSTKSGRRLMSWIFDFCGLYKTSMHQTGSVFYFNEGRKNLAYEMQDMIKRNFIDLFHQMEREKLEREEIKNA